MFKPSPATSNAPVVRVAVFQSSASHYTGSLGVAPTPRHVNRLGPSHLRVCLSRARASLFIMRRCLLRIASRMDYVMIYCTALNDIIARQGVPSAVFSQPPVAMCGLTEEDAARRRRLVSSVRKLTRIEHC